MNKISGCRDEREKMGNLQKRKKKIKNRCEKKELKKVEQKWDEE